MSRSAVTVLAACLCGWMAAPSDVFPRPVPAAVGGPSPPERQQTLATSAAIEPAAPLPVSTRTDARVSLSELLTADSYSDQHISFSQLRTSLVADDMLAVRSLALHIDGRWRRGWTPRTRSEQQISLFNLQYGGRRDGTPVVLGLGRQTVLSLFGVQLDGLFAGLRLADGVTAGFFGGTVPHPFTGALDTDFRSAGSAYDVRGTRGQHGGGLVFQWYKNELDRLYITERANVRLTRSVSLYGHTVLDILAPQGIIGALQPRHRGDDEAGQSLLGSGMDITNAQLRLLFRPSARFNATAGVHHVHTLLPNRWWHDWLLRERQKRGFAEETDADLPAGTRRTSARLTTSVRLSPTFIPFAVLRRDWRQNDDARGYEARPGVKLLVGDHGYIELDYSYRDYYGTKNQRADLDASWDLFAGLLLEAHVSALRSRPADPHREPVILYDIGGVAHVLLGSLHESLAGAELMLQYQGFREPGLTFHVMFAQLSFRQRT